jgi:hypothetical protein
MGGLFANQPFGKGPLELEAPSGNVVLIGEWRSLVSAPALGAGGRRFKSDLPDFLMHDVDHPKERGR